ARQEVLCDFDHGALSQIVRVGFEGQAKNDDFGMAARRDQTEQMLKVLLIAQQQILQERQADTVLVAIVPKRSDIFRQTRAAKRIAWPQIVWGKIEPGVLTQQLHHL